MASWVNVNLDNIRKRAPTVAPAPCEIELERSIKQLLHREKTYLGDLVGAGMVILVFIIASIASAIAARLQGYSWSQAALCAVVTACTTRRVRFGGVLAGALYVLGALSAPVVALAIILGLAGICLGQLWARPESFVRLPPKAPFSTWTSPANAGRLWKGRRALGSHRPALAVKHYERVQHTRSTLRIQALLGLATANNRLGRPDLAVARVQEAKLSASTGSTAETELRLLLEHADALVALADPNEGAEIVLSQLETHAIEAGHASPQLRDDARLATADLARLLGRLAQADPTLLALAPSTRRVSTRVRAEALASLSLRALEIRQSKLAIQLATRAVDVVDDVYFSTSAGIASKSSLAVVLSAGRFYEAELARSRYAILLARILAELGSYDEAVSRAQFQVDDTHSGGRTALLTRDESTVAGACYVLAMSAHAAGIKPAAEWYVGLALSNLVRVRYQLTSAGQRQAWVISHGAVVDLALRVAIRSSPGAVCEVIENIRMQAIPGELSLSRAPQGDGDLSASRFRARRKTNAGHELPARISLFRDALSHVTTHLGAADSRLCISDVIATVSDKHWLWMTYHVSNDKIYWAAATPRDEADRGLCVEAGVEDLSPTSYAADVLSRVRAALPIDPAVDLRSTLRSSPLWSDPVAEQRLMSALGRCLLPPGLQKMIRQLPTGNATIVISPASELGFVPWGLVGLSPGCDDDAEPRLIEIGDVVLAPSISLLDQAAKSVDRPGPQRTILVIDPTDASIESTFAPLRGARALTGEREAGTVRLTGTWDESPNRQLATPRRVKAELADAGQRSTLMIAAHCVPGGPWRPEDIHVPLVRDESGDRLSAAHLFRSEETGFRPPDVVILSVCDAAGLEGARVGDWASLAPALMTAGARTVVATMFPLVDDKRLDSRLLESAPGESSAVVQTLYDYQRASLVRWRSGSRASPPLLWAGHLPIGMLRNRLSAKPSELTAYGGAHGHQNSQRFLDQSAVDLISDIALPYEAIDPAVVTTVDLALVWLEDHNEDTRNGLIATSLQNLLMADVLPAELFRSVVLGPLRLLESLWPGARKTGLSASTRRVMNKANALAVADDRPTVQAEDVVYVLARSLTVGGLLLRCLRYGQRRAVRTELREVARWRAPSVGSATQIRPHYKDSTRHERIAAGLIEAGWIPGVTQRRLR